MSDVITVTDIERLRADLAVAKVLRDVHERQLR